MTLCENVPILITAYNRPQKIQQLINSLSETKEYRIYINIDGPKDEKDIQKQNEIINIIKTTIAIDNTVVIRAQSQNSGCDRSVVAALEWVFAEEDSAIILEDDVIVSKQFVPFSAQLLKKYWNDMRVAQIAAMSILPNIDIQESYYFTNIMRCSGCWATWRRAWQNYTDDMSRYNDIYKEQIDKVAVNKFEYNRILRSHIAHLQGKRYNWDYRWNIACWSQSALSIVPVRNMMSNIGFDEQGTHTVNAVRGLSNLPVENIQFPLKHPDFVVPAKSYEIEIYKYLQRRKSIKDKIKYYKANIL